MPAPESPAVSGGRKLFLLLLWLVVIGVYVAAILPQREAPHLGYSDKFDHMAAFFVVTLLARIAYLRRPVLPLLLGIALFGALIEITQMLPFLHRDAEFGDWVADVLATMAASLVAQPIVIMIRHYRDRQWRLAQRRDEPADA